MEGPLNARPLLLTQLIINRLHMLINTIAISALFYYRATTLRRIIQTKETPLLPYLAVIFCEVVLTFLWILHQSYRWRPVRREVYPERLPAEDKFVPIDVFICTADPVKEPAIEVMNTVISAMSLDYPPEKLAVYLHDDGGSYVTLNAVREAWKFARVWIPYSRKYGLKNRCPMLYFEGEECADEKFVGSSEFATDRKIIEVKYSEFQDALEKNSVNASSSISRNHPPTIEVMTDDLPELKDMPKLIYLSREKRPGVPHHFKGGALNSLIRVSAVISNAPYCLVMDCDMYSSDPTSARQAMCYILDPKVEPGLGWVQYPQKFRNATQHDIYDGMLNPIWREGKGTDGLRGANIYGCNLFMRREALYRKNKIKRDLDISQLKKTFGVSNELVKSIYPNYNLLLPEDRKPSDTLAKELQLLASCSYAENTEWGTEVGYIYNVVEDAYTSFLLHCEGWISVFVDPERPCFLGSCTTSLSDMLVQQTRWSFGLLQQGLSKHCAIIYGPMKMSVLMSMTYGALMLDAFYVFPLYGLGIIPPICLLAGVPLYPKVSEPIFYVFAYIFVASILKHIQEVFTYCNGNLMNALYEMRTWMMKSGSCYLYATLNVFLERLGFHEANFTLTNKSIDDEQAKRHKDGIYDFLVTPMILVPMCTAYILNLTCLAIGITRIIRQSDEFFIQTVLALFGVITNFHFFQGMFLRSDTGRIAPSVTLLSGAISTVIVACGYALLIQ